MSTSSISTSLLAVNALGSALTATACTDKALVKSLRFMNSSLSLFFKNLSIDGPYESAF